MLESKADATENGNWDERLFEKFRESQDGPEDCKTFIYNKLSLK